MEIIVDPSSSSALRTSKFYFDNSQDFWWLDRYTVPATDENGIEIEPQFSFNSNRTQLTLRFGWQPYSAANFNFSDPQYFPVFPNASGAVIREVHVDKGTFLVNDPDNWKITEKTISVEWKSSLAALDTSAVRYDIIRIKSDFGVSPDDFFGNSFDMTWEEYLYANDTIRGSWGNDFIFGYSGADQLYGEAGDDELHGGAGSDDLYGGPGNDILFAYQDYDDIELSDPNFVNLLDFERLTSVDHLYGGAGDDVYVFDRMVNTPLVFENANEGVDTIVGDLLFYVLPDNVENYVNDLSIDKSPNGDLNIIEIIGNSLSNIIKTSPDSWDSLYDIVNTVDPLWGANEVFDGGDGNDLLISGGGVDHLYGGNGDDILQGGGDQDFLEGGDGSDTADYSDKMLPITVALKADSWSDVLVNGVIEDFIIEIENVIGGSGNDLFSGDRNDNFFTGGGGIDTVTYEGISASSNGISADMSAGIIRARSLTNTEVGTDRILEIENVIGTAYDDVMFGDKSGNTLTGGRGDDILNGGKGADILIGGFGNDRYFVDNKNDVILELEADNFIGVGDDGIEIKQETVKIGNYNDAVVASVHYTLNAGAAVEDMLAAGRLTGTRMNANLSLTGNELDQGLIGNEGDNTLSGMAGNDALFGFAGNDQLFGGDGDDMFLGGTGNDVMSGGEGNDWFAFGFGVSDGWDFNNLSFRAALTGGRDRADGGNGSEDALLVKTYDVNSIQIEREKVGAEYQFSVTGLNDESIQIRNIEKISFVDLSDDLYFGRSFWLDSAVISLTGGGLSVVGAQDDDWIVGTGKNDVMDGGDGNDILRGGRGNDQLRGGLGSDSLTGGAGADRFILTVPANGEMDTITDFTRGDKIELDHTFGLLHNGVNAGNILSLTDDQMRFLSFYQQSDDYLIFNKSTSTLFYDADGSLDGAAVALVEISGINKLSHTDFSTPPPTDLWAM